MLARSFLGSSVLGALVLASSTAGAESIIKNPGDHPRYSFEAEPHLALDPYGGRTGFGPGFRGTFTVLHNGFVSTINNSIGIGVGLDWLFYDRDCPRNVDCDQVTDALLPVVLQWNFWLHPQWSVFGEPGVAFHIRNGPDDKFRLDPFVIYGGARFHFSESVALTFRVGAPVWRDWGSTLSVGVSFLL